MVKGNSFEGVTRLARSAVFRDLVGLPSQAGYGQDTGNPKMFTNTCRGWNIASRPSTTRAARAAVNLFPGCCQQPQVGDSIISGTTVMLTSAL